ncbi:DEAD/DEAH box helicase family protein [Methylomonas montana]|uniref:type I restriction endonuclease subunit R, EcoR124 family n=1 Tax=Methylomonas montana TaxID=3058963 RepID=UPI00265A4199|nr:DEAD/DEAH box helicase family protein [Methylomonas montana]WKJ89938.1 DEAD/DEAH box helicase family protein [Methylomonas montana]
MTLKENQIEQRLIGKLTDLKYNPRPDIRDRESLEQNFRQKFEALNRVHLTDAEFARLRDELVTADVFTAAKTLRERNYFQREDGTPLHYTLVNIKDWCKNDFEIVNQLRINTDNSHHRYDVILLINGVPVVQIELKTLQVSPRRAMEQIVEYKNDPGNGYSNALLCFMQLFIVSNESNTYYFANNHRQHFSFNADERFLPIYQLADEANQKIAHLHDFADTFLAKCTLGQMISRYMVLVASEQKLMIMRPYQIYAVKAIVDCIHQNRGNGYIWHTTGSGKTLTSFKASTLLKDNPDIEKCLFVVDRKDLDRQTREEFNRFQEGCVEENTNTETLVRRMLSEDYADKVIVTTIQKLGLALDENSKRNQTNSQKGKPTYKQRLEPLRDKRVVFIFDECHRSQFGEKPWGNIIDFRYQEDAVDEAIKLFSGKDQNRAKEIWLVEPAPVMVNKLRSAVDKLATFMKTQGLDCTPEQVANLKGDKARADFINHFKEVQRLKTRLDQYTDLGEEQHTQVEQLLPADTLRSFKGVYLDTAQRLKVQQGKGNDSTSTVEQLEFEFVLFASAVIDYDYIMELIAKSTQGPSKQKMTRQELIDKISSDANLMEQRDDIIDYINSLPVGKSLSVTAIHEGYQAFKAAKAASDLSFIADKHRLEPPALQAFVDTIMNRMIFDGEKLSDLLSPLELGWKARTQAELALMDDLLPLLHKLAQGREISGLAAYE